ncbi:uncharacterized protein LY89DRAFT_137942 [Mollisia scopiformis]|uniref:Uncharacterized protein n=1 Tax=Mollisia scopiformis TaxID=149040 RepID=A0A194X2H6_MOLSC|nr:uncharacterized protein LY89DRAFT_137942 [Mollisia scopiformis]KUJ14396.1 hypothetical protein LY89DRAFT_137942 [Mollisia scopiformis]
MSVFSKIVMSRKAAKEHKNKVAEKDKEPEQNVKAPYKHIPTHAAVDALSGAPSSWKHEDRPKIKEHHKRRSQMVISRTGSSLSHMSYMNAAGSATNIPPLPRNSSYSSYNPTWFDRGGDVYYSNENQRQKPPRSHSYHDSGIGPSIGPSPLASQQQSEGTSFTIPTEEFASIAHPSPLDNRLTSSAEVSPVVSSGNSTNSNSSAENLEIAPASKSNRLSSRPQPIVYAEKDIFDRLHTSTTRKVGEAPLYDAPPPMKTKTPTTVVTQETTKPKKQRWSILGKKNATATAVVV